MTQLRERTTLTTRPPPDEATVEREDGHTATILRTLGAVAVLVVGAVHLEQYLAGYHNISVIGPLFLLNFAGSTVIGLGLLVPAVRLRAVHLLCALGGIALAGTSFVFLFVSEHEPLFGFQESGYRAAIVVALAAEAVAVVTLAAYVVMRMRRS
ncbi:MAG TPA: hypothetical protein VHS03_07415 [Gaiellaceae bacterium]|jgi:hypothetical protein|nr:hypothetical protein [Gaiellaceae bacterium]